MLESKLAFAGLVCYSGDPDRQGDAPIGTEGALQDGTTAVGGRDKSAEAEHTHSGPRRSNPPQTCSGFLNQAIVDPFRQPREANGWGLGLRRWGPDGRKSSRRPQGKGPQQPAEGGGPVHKQLAFGGAHVVEVVGDDAAVEEAALVRFLQSLLIAGDPAPFSLIPHVVRTSRQSLLLAFESPEAAKWGAGLLEEAGYTVREALQEALDVVSDEEDRLWLSPPRARPESSVGVAVRVLAHELRRPELLKLQAVEDLKSLTRRGRHSHTT
eukprot:jgi/Botrbrau1/9436/Bobra.0252s0059.2